MDRLASVLPRFCHDCVCGAYLFCSQTPCIWLDASTVATRVPASCRAQVRSSGAVALDALWTWTPHRSHVRCLIVIMILAMNPDGD